MSASSYTEARMLWEARKTLQRVAPRVIWQRTFPAYQVRFGRTVRVEVTRDLTIRVIDPKSGQLLASGRAEGPAAP